MMHVVMLAMCSICSGQQFTFRLCSPEKRCDVFRAVLNSFSFVLLVQMANLETGI